MWIGVYRATLVELRAGLPSVPAQQLDRRGIRRLAARLADLFITSPIPSGSTAVASGAIVPLRGEADRLSSSGKSQSVLKGPDTRPPTGDGTMPGRRAHQQRTGVMIVEDHRFDYEILPTARSAAPLSAHRSVPRNRRRLPRSGMPQAIGAQALAESAGRSPRASDREEWRTRAVRRTGVRQGGRW